MTRNIVVFFRHKEYSKIARHLEQVHGSEEE